MTQAINERPQPDSIRFHLRPVPGPFTFATRLMSTLHFSAREDERAALRFHVCHLASALAGIAALAMCLTATAREDTASAPKRLKRSDSFLGIHFDFHAGKDCVEVGKNTTPDMIESIINQVRPDYLQIDCKGHPGISSYPTKVGNPAPGFVGDPLRVWRDVTARNGVALYMHYSGVWDSEAIAQHPAWGVVNADGKINPNATSRFSAYEKELIVPQLRELAGTYGVDGVWVDGECWASAPDYSDPALKAFREATGFGDIPRKDSDAHWREFLDFNREAFRQYLRRYVSAVKATHPKFQLCSNWAFTDHMPEPVSAPVDFLSGDYSPQNSVNSARISARYLARQGQPWDLMAWGFTTQPGQGGRTLKTAVQLEREAAMVMALGGGFQVYLGQKRDGSVHLERIPVMAEVAKFCRARQEFCHHATQVPQIGLLYSTAAHYRRINGLFSREPSPLQGTLEALLESQQSVEVLGEHNLTGRTKEYPLIIVPEWEYLEPKFHQELVEYVAKGGNLLLIGPGPVGLFREELGVKFEEAPRRGALTLSRKEQTSPMKTIAQGVALPSGARAFGSLRETAQSSGKSIPAASVAHLGRGTISALYFAFSQNYLETYDETARQFLCDLVRELLPEPMVEVSGSKDVEVVVNRLRRNLSINLVNTSGPHRTEPIIDTIPEIGPLTVMLRQKSKPAHIRMQPEGKDLEFEWRAGVARVTIPKLAVHEILVVE